MNNDYDINKVMEYFYEISKIPRKSGKEEKIADYIENFAKKRNLEYIRDIYNNIIVIKNKSKWNKSNDTIILQSHLDMICEKEEYSNHNFDEDELELYIDGDFIKAKDTTLGADNGIGVAIMLAILDSNEINHPRIEAIFTVEEETTMKGAREIDVSMLKGNKMICLDNMNENELWLGCAEAKIFQYKINGVKKNISKEYALIEIGLNGFLGGHSGKNIADKRGNAIEEMVNLLKSLHTKYDIYIKNIYGGRKVNVIPRECYCKIYVKYEDLNSINQEIVEFNKLLKVNIPEENNEDIELTIKEIEEDSQERFDLPTTQKIINIINSIPNGVYYKDKYGNPLVSLNIGKIEVRDEIINLEFSIRSNRSEIEKILIDELEEIEHKNNIQKSVNELAGYEHKERSKFIDKCKTLYRQYFSKSPKLIDMHVCLEAGFFGQKIKDLDFIAIAPNIYDAHSPKEKCSISSLKRVYNYIILILENL